MGRKDLRMKRIGKRLLAGFIAMSIMLAMMPAMTVTVLAEDSPAIQFVTDGSVPDIKGGQESTVWFGNYQQSSNSSGGFNTEPVKWRVLDNADNKLLLLSDQTLYGRRYHDFDAAVTWETSEIRKSLNNEFLKDAFEEEEKKAIATAHLVNDSNSLNNISGGNDTDDQIFLLSTREARNTSYGFTEDTSDTNVRQAKATDYAKQKARPDEYGNCKWWLRSPGVYDKSAAFVDNDGYLDQIGADASLTNTIGVRPAFYLDLNLDSLLFTSAAEDGKKSGNAGADALTQVSSSGSSEWKFTLKDQAHSLFTILNTSYEEDGVSVEYYGATFGTNEYISAVITDKPITETDAKILYYGRIKQCSSWGDIFGTVKINTAGKMKGEDTLYVFLEQYHADQATDYASELIAVSTCHKITTKNNAYMQITSDKSTACPGEKVTVKTWIQGSYSPRLYVTKTSDGSTVQEVELTGTKQGFEGSFTMPDYDVTIIGKIQRAGEDDTLSVKGKTATVNYNSLKKQSVSLARSKIITIKNKGKAALKFKLVSAKKGNKSCKKYFRINSKTGRITIKKGLKKGTYKVTVKVSMEGGTAKKATVKIRIR